VESSLSIAQIAFSEPITSTEKEGNRNEGNEEAFSSDQAAITLTEGDEIEPETVKPSSLTTCFSQTDIENKVFNSLDSLLR